jgi:hypothetical protein
MTHTLTEADRKMLREFAGLKLRVRPFTFTTGNNMIALAKALQKKGEWREFLRLCFDSEEGKETDIKTIHDWDTYSERYYNEDFIAWLLKPSRFCWLCAKFVREKNNG